MVDVPTRADKEISPVWHVAGMHRLAQVWNAIIPQHEAHNCAGAAGASGVLV